MKALVLAGGVPQAELLKQLRIKGFNTILADGNSQCIAYEFADKFYHVDIFNVNEIKKIAIDENVDFLITVCADQVLLVVAEVSEMLGLPCYINYKTAQDVSDKIRMKRIFKLNNIPTSNFVELNNFDLDKINELKYPLVVKPVDAYSSKGVRKVADIDELKKYYTEAAQISRSGHVIVEEYFSGEEISVDAFVVNGKAKILCISNSEKIANKDRFVIFRGRYPATSTKRVIKKIEKIAQDIADAFGLFNSPLLIQLINNGDDVSVLEFCARTGGNMKWLLIKYACGVDVIGATVDITLGKEPDLREKNIKFNIVVNDFIYCKPGIFDHFEGIDRVYAEGLVNEFHAVRVKGTEMYGVTSSSDRIAGINIVAETVEDFNKKQRKILNTIKVIDVNGKDIMRRDLLPDLI